MEKWMVAAKKADFNAIAQKYGITPVLARIMRNRDLTEDEEIRLFLKGTLADRPSPFALYGMEKAAELLLLKIREGKKIRVIGDYDVDGICSTYILCCGIQALSGKADRVIPHRIRDGYGLNISLIENAREDEVDTILTCDNGIAAFEEISLARDYGMTVIVTDHHEVPYTEENGNKEYHLPPADVVVDPKQSADTSHFKGICGALIAYKLIEALCEKSGEEEKKKSLQKELLPFAALATVCDVMELRDENRIIVKYGMQQMKETENPGLLALLQVNDLMDKELSPYHAGFILGPCLNATGRLDSADRALRLFEETDFKKAVTEAYDLKSLNDSRKQMTEDGVSEAVRMLEAEGREQDPVLVVYLPDCHESIAGIIAGRLKEKYHKPVLVATRAEEGIKGSGRSIEAYSMYEELSKCRELFTKFGGHKMAAGFSLAGEGDLNELRKRLNENSTLTEEDFREVVHIDVPMPLSYADNRFVKELSLLEPFGAGNPKPVFAQKNVRLLSGKILGKNRNVGKFRIADESGSGYDMIYFGDMEKLDRFLSETYGEHEKEALYSGSRSFEGLTVSMVYYPEINRYMGRESIQIVMQYYC